jgi:hypothetical protein
MQNTTSSPSNVIGGLGVLTHKKVQYNGKELQTQSLGGRALDWYDCNTQMYDPTHREDAIVRGLMSARANAVYRYLLQNGISHTRMKKSTGKIHYTPEGRKVEFNLTK